jgi:plastocyanin
VRVLPKALLLCLLLPVPAARAADHPLVWPACCSSGTPEETAVAVDDTVTFNTIDFGAHPLVWDFGDFPVKDSGSTQQYAFGVAGSYPFHCQLHSYMVGIVKVGANAHPTADFSFAPAAPEAGQAVTFTATATDSDGTVVSYQWDLDGNGSFEKTTASASTTHTYAAGGTYAAKLRVLDNGHDMSAVATRSVTVTTPPAPGPDPGGGGSGGGTGTPDGTGGGGVPATEQQDGGGDAAAPIATRGRVTGGRLRLALDEAAALDGVLRRGTRKVRKLHAQLKAGAVSVRLPKGLRRGRYSVRFTLTDAAGNRSRAVTVRFRVP